MDDYKIYCINLKRRTDRKENIIKLFESENITNYEFYEAIDGNTISQDDPSLSLFKHSWRLRKGAVGCAMSHYNLWKNLLSDMDNNYYVIVEDDIKLGPDFKMNLGKILDRMTAEITLVLFGVTVSSIKYEETRKTYLHDTSYTLHPLERDLYCGGAFGYVITKYAAAKLIHHINNCGCKMAIDWLMFRCGPPIYETRPHLIFTDAVQECTHYVDSDIQHNTSAIIIDKVVNTYVFDDYIFYPNKDSPGGDIREAYADITMLKKMADNINDCIAFNTYGWLKHTLVSLDKFVDIENKYYTIDGIYVKKSFVFK